MQPAGSRDLFKPFYARSTRHFLRVRPAFGRHPMAMDRQLGEQHQFGTLLRCSLGPGLDFIEVATGLPKQTVHLDRCNFY